MNVIQIFPREGDDWEQSPPIQSQYTDNSLIFAYGDVSNIREYLSTLGTVVEGYLESFSSFSNEINFLQKTKVGQKTDTTTTDGIGGLAKLKDFEFTLIKSGVNITEFIGCYVEVFTLNEDTLLRDIHFKGKIYTPSTTRTSVSYVVRGVLSANETYIEGKKNGDENDIIFLGGGEKYIKLQKRVDKEGNTKLICDTSKYNVLGIYVKEKDSQKKLKEAKYFPISDSYKIVDDEIIFQSLNTSPVVLAKESFAHFQRIKITPTCFVGVSFEGGAIGSFTIRDSAVAYKYIGQQQVGVDLLNVYSTSPFGGYEGILAGLLDGTLTAIVLDDVDDSSAGVKKVLKAVKIEESPIPNSLFINKQPKNDYSLFTQDCLLEPNLGSPMPHSLTQISLRKKGGEVVLTSYKAMSIIDDNYYNATFLYFPSRTNLSSISVGDSLDILSPKGTQDYVNFKFKTAPSFALQCTRGFENVAVGNGSISVDLNRKFVAVFPNLDSYTVLTPSDGYETTERSYSDEFATFSLNLPELSGNILKATLDAKISIYLFKVKYAGYYKNPTIKIGMQGASAFFEQEYGSRTEPSVMLNYAIPTANLFQRDPSKVSSSDPLDYATFRERAFYFSYSGFNIFDFSDSTSLDIANEEGSFGLSNISIDIDMEASIKDNDFYALITEKQTSTFYLWDEIQRIDLETLCGFLPLNYSAYFEKIGSTGYFYIACSDGILYKYFTFSLSEVSLGLLNLLPKRTGQLNGDLPIVIKASTGAYYWDSSEKNVANCQTDFATFYWQIGTTTLLAENVLRNVFSQFFSDDYKITVDSTNSLELVLSKKQSGISMSNPVGIIYRLLTQYAKVPVEFFNTDKTYETALRREGWKAELTVSSAEAINDLVDTLAKEHGLFVFENNEGLITILSLDPPSESTVTLELGRDDILIGDIDENYTGIEYLISQLDTTYSDGEEKLEGSLLDQTPFSVARKYLNGDEAQMNLVLKTVFDSATAQNSAELKQLYHYIPTRILKIAIRPELGIGLGAWVKISEDSGIDLVRGKVYLVQFIEKMLFEDAILNIELYEFDIDTLEDFIQEVPRHPDEIIEVIDSGDEISELII